MRLILISICSVSSHYCLKYVMSIVISHSHCNQCGDSHYNFAFVGLPHSSANGDYNHTYNINWLLDYFSKSRTTM